MLIEVGAEEVKSGAISWEVISAAYPGNDDPPTFFA